MCLGPDRIDWVSWLSQRTPSHDTRTGARLASLQVGEKPDAAIDRARHRPTKDLDLLARGDSDPGSLTDVFGSLCLSDVDGDGLTFDARTIVTAPIRESGVVFVLESTDRASAEAALATLPLIADRQLRVELTELRPFLNWAMVGSGRGGP